MVKRCFQIWLIASLILVTNSVMAEPMPQRFVGKWGDAAVSITLQNLSAGDITGEAEEAWIDSAGQRRSGLAKIVGIRHADGIDLFLQPQSLITLPFVFHADAATPNLMTLEVGDRVPTVALQPGNDADYQTLLKDLKSSAGFPIMPIAETPESETSGSELSSLAAIEQAGLDRADGCQCDAEKKAHVASATASFTKDVARLLARVNDYIMGVEATRTAFTSGQQTSLASMYIVSAEDRTDPASKDWREFTDRVLEGDRSLNAFNRAFEEAGQEIDVDLGEAAQRCHQRELTASEAVAPEAKLWRATCLAVARGSDLYQSKKTAYATDILAARTTMLHSR